MHIHMDIFVCFLCVELYLLFWRTPPESRGIHESPTSSVRKKNRGSTCARVRPTKVCGERMLFKRFLIMSINRFLWVRRILACVVGWIFWGGLLCRVYSHECLCVHDFMARATQEAVFCGVCGIYFFELVRLCVCVCDLGK